MEQTHAVGFEKSGLAGRDCVKMTSVSVDGNQKPQAPVEIGMWLLRLCVRRQDALAPLEGAVAGVAPWPRCSTLSSGSPSAPSACQTPSLQLRGPPILPSSPFDCVPLAKLAEARYLLSELL